MQGSAKPSRATAANSSLLATSRGSWERRYYTALGARMNSCANLETIENLRGTALNIITQNQGKSTKISETQ
jgi:hypothetical protein